MSSGRGPSAEIGVTRYYPKRFWARLIAIACVLLFLFIGISVNGFLAVTHPVGRGILVVEAWIPKATLAESIKSYDKGSYRYLVVVGEPRSPNDSQTNAARAVTELKRLGFDTVELVEVDVPFQSRNRTVAKARALKQWLEDSKRPIRSVDVFTVGVHARKSWVLFRHVLGDGYQVGIVAGPESTYNPKLWAISRRGLYLVARNLVGYVYAKLWVFFHTT
jgi:hypothetical protein